MTSEKRDTMTMTIIVTVVILCGVGFFWWLESSEREWKERDSTVMSMTDIGTVNSVEFLKNGQSVVHTDRGDFCVSGRFQTMRGTPVVLEKRVSGRRYICTQDEQEYCKRLVR